MKLMNYGLKLIIIQKANIHLESGTKISLTAIKHMSTHSRVLMSVVLLLRMQVSVRRFSIS